MVDTMHTNFSLFVSIINMIYIRHCGDQFYWEVCVFGGMGGKITQRTPRPTACH